MKTLSRWFTRFIVIAAILSSGKLLYEQYADAQGIANLKKYYEDSPEQKDMHYIFRYLNKNAIKGDAASQTDLASIMYIHPELGYSYANALEMLNRAIKQNYPPAFGLLAIFYCDGIGVQIDFKIALEVAMQGIILGDKTGRSHLAAGISTIELFDDSNTLSQAIPHFTWAAKNGKNRVIRGGAEGLLARAWFFGVGVNADLATSLSWARKSTANGSELALPIIGYCQINGEGMPQNIKEGYQLLERLSAKEDEMAQFFLAIWLLDQENDNAKQLGMKYLELSAKNKYEPAVNLFSMYDVK